MKFEINYEKEDWVKFQSFLKKDSSKSRSKQYWQDYLFGAVFIIVFLFFLNKLEVFDWGTAILLFYAMAFIIIYYCRIYKQVFRYFEPMDEGAFIGKYTIELSEEKIYTSSKNSNASIDWSVVKRAVKTKNAIYLFIDSSVAYIFPIQKVQDIETLEKIINKTFGEIISF